MATRMSEHIWVQTDIFTIRSKLYFQVTFFGLAISDWDRRWRPHWHNYWTNTTTASKHQLACLLHGLCTPITIWSPFYLICRESTYSNSIYNTPSMNWTVLSMLRLNVLSRDILFPSIRRMPSYPKLFYIINDIFWHENFYIKLRIIV